MTNNLKVFISYSHDSDEHKALVLGLAQRLRDYDGIDTMIDQYINGTPIEGWQRWMLNQLDGATHVLCVCTESYYKRFRGHEQKTNSGLGVDFEGFVITNEIYDSRSRTIKFVPVMFNQDGVSPIPEPLRGQTHYVLNSIANYQSLLDFLDGVAGVEPAPIGQKVPRVRKQAPALQFADESLTANVSSESARRRALNENIGDVPETVEPRLKIVFPDSQPLSFPDESEDDDEKRVQLIDLAAGVLVKNVIALNALATHLKIPDSSNIEDRAKLTIEALLKDRTMPEMLLKLISVILQLDKNKTSESKLAADKLEEVAYYVIPASLIGDHLKQIQVIIDSVPGKDFQFESKTKTFVEIAMARANGRSVQYRAIQKPSDTPIGIFCLSDPPEEGMDKDDEQFINNFIAELGKITIDDLIDLRSPSQTIAAINAELEMQWTLEGWQYYYIFENPANPSLQRKRHGIADRLDKMFPRIAFISLDKSATAPLENEILLSMRRILCRAAGIEIKPHGN